MGIQASDSPSEVTLRKLEPSDRITDSVLRRMGEIASQLEAQHRRLDPFFAQVATALAKGRSHDAQTAAFQLEGALGAHFLYEEEAVFPSIRCAFPEMGDELDALCDEHVQARAKIQAAITNILESQLERARDSFVACAIFLTLHEGRELALISEACESASSCRNSGEVDLPTIST